MKTALYASALTVALLAGQVCGASAQALPNTVKNGDRGSVLVFPLIDITPALGTTVEGVMGPAGVDTFIEISNDQTVFGPLGQDGVWLKCVYVNEKKGRDDFSVYISAGGSVSWDVKTLAGDHVSPTSFPIDGTFPSGTNNYPPTSIYRGELICIATDPAGVEALAYNRLYGRATVMYDYPTGDAGATEAKQAFRYNAFTFRAWNNDLLAPDYTIMATPMGVPPTVYLPLTGGAPSPTAPLVTPYYDACPAVNSTAFMPAGATLGNIGTFQNFVHGVGCNQDLTEPFDGTIYTTQLRFITENSKEEQKSAAYTCVDSVFAFAFGPIAAVSGFLADPQDFDVSVLGDASSPPLSPDARLQVYGTAGSQCVGSIEANVAVGLLTVFDSQIVIPPPTPVVAPVVNFDQTVANTNETVGGAITPPAVPGGPTAGFIVFTPGF